jgi:hypothetical protein
MRSTSRLVNDIVWEIEHFVDTNVTLVFAWTYMTNVANWDDPPARFELDGPFAVGSRGTTRIPGQEARQWRLREVKPMTSYVFEMPLDRAAISFEWRFDARGDGKTRLTQPVFTSNLAPGMARITAAMERSQSEQRP